MSGQNLDRLCAKYGWKISDQLRPALGKGAENLITNSLGVLQEDGVYAFFLYLASRGSEKAGAEKLREQTHNLLKEAGILPFDTTKDSLEAVRGNKEKQVRGMADDLDSLLLAKRLLEQTLIYARYHAKAILVSES